MCAINGQALTGVKLHDTLHAVMIALDAGQVYVACREIKLELSVELRYSSYSCTLVELFAQVVSTHHNT